VRIIGAVAGILTEPAVIFSQDHAVVGIDLVAIFSPIIVVVASDQIGIHQVSGQVDVHA
jgi:hypothetical protein